MQCIVNDQRTTDKTSPLLYAGLYLDRNTTEFDSFAGQIVNHNLPHSELVKAHIHITTMYASDSKATIIGTPTRQYSTTEKEMEIAIAGYYFWEGPVTNYLVAYVNCVQASYMCAYLKTLGFRFPEYARKDSGNDKYRPHITIAKNIGGITNELRASLEKLNEEGTKYPLRVSDIFYRNI